MTALLARTCCDPRLPARVLPIAPFVPLVGPQDATQETAAGAGEMRERMHYPVSPACSATVVTFRLLRFAKNREDRRSRGYYFGDCGDGE